MRDAAEEPNRTLVPFVVCGDLAGFDSDRTYPLEVSFSCSPCLDDSFLGVPWLLNLSVVEFKHFFLVTVQIAMSFFFIRHLVDEV